MDNEKILQHVDHTLLAVTATWEDIAAVCGDGMRYGVASVCIPPAYVARAKEYAGGKLKICTVIGFPNGYMTAAAKLAETADALANGADEIDMVINLGDVKGGRFESILDEIKQIKAACGGKILKVIVEACLLNGAEKLKLCETVTAAGADFIKTSTGFSTGGATLDDVRLFRKHVGKNVRIKAAGGIKTLADAEAFISAGADRLGTSAIVKLVKGQEAGGY